MPLTSDSCNSTFLAQMAALANQIQNPIPPTPLFFNNSQCNQTASMLPQNYVTVSCPATGVPTFENNCMRIITDYTGNFNPLSGPPLDPSQINVLPRISGICGSPSVNYSSNVFPDETDVLFSWYCPPQMYMVFYVEDPTAMTLDNAAAGGYLLVPPNTIQPDAFLSQIKLSNGNPFICGTGGKTNLAPYFIIVQIMDFGQMLVNMCAYNNQYSIGPDLTNNSLNRVWIGQTVGCDQYITSLCATSDLSDSPYAQLCACFTQQQQLNSIYGASLNVPVCCFAPPGVSIEHTCSYNTEAYKTRQMQASCCSFAQCQTIWNNTPKLQVQTTPLGEIFCAGQFVVFPTVNIPLPNVIPTVIINTESEIPSYIWIVLGVSIGLLLLWMLMVLLLKPYIILPKN